MKQMLIVGGVVLAAAVLILILISGDGGEDFSDFTKTESGLRYKDLKEGSGIEAKEGDKVVVHYIGTLKNGTKFDSSRDRNKPFDFTLGEGQVIRGWDEGVAGMKVGGVRKLIIPPHLGYGSRGSPPTIPPNAELHFEVQLLKIN
ncbi:MAG TPA: FKBP-type peptidyl-prolyl cis-trans isomerase [Gemmataceae bacterium]|nr:FKBP-type peptidyl-prolyl cis-trans isomerase [Gemmataceae bacterium]